MNTSLIIRCAAMALTACSCLPSLADETPMKTVSYADLNLGSRAGVEALYRRIERAAAEVCDMPQGTLQLKLDAELKTCRADATDRAIVHANLPRLNALHLAKTGRNVGNSQYVGRR
jgi:UrcA family protein